ncbi:hypothetical protein PYCCODRAFT_459493 [Trametes coccinea BRFM310]|uniref:Uncharacterized protein n=1 Tax=Trametes coccinea (strain BRFM310) TaxID=1353009 RepID=A0A1Y2INY1_TRAC3|nr:hypothetical protein PYCCODRAFT_459493 [Trametes coccinea BRFM310]
MVHRLCPLGRTMTQLPILDYVSSTQLSAGCRSPPPIRSVRVAVPSKDPLCSSGANVRPFQRFEPGHPWNNGRPGRPFWDCGQTVAHKMADALHTLRSSVHPHPRLSLRTPLLRPLIRQAMASSNENTDPWMTSSADKLDDAHVERFGTNDGDLSWAQGASTVLREHTDGTGRPPGTVETQPATVNPADVLGSSHSSTDVEAAGDDGKVLNVTQDIAQGQRGRVQTLEGSDGPLPSASTPTWLAEPPTQASLNLPGTTPTAPSNPSRSRAPRARSVRGSRPASGTSSSASVPPGWPSNFDPALLNDSDAPYGASAAAPSRSARGRPARTRGARGRRAAPSGTPRYAPGEGPAFTLEAPAPTASQYSLPPAWSSEPDAPSQRESAGPVASSSRWRGGNERTPESSGAPTQRKNGRTASRASARAQRAKPYARAEPEPTPSSSSLPKGKGRTQTTDPPEEIIFGWDPPARPWVWDGVAIPDDIKEDKAYDYLRNHRGVKSTWPASHCRWEGCEYDPSSQAKQPAKKTGPNGIKRHIEGTHLVRNARCGRCGGVQRWDRWRDISHTGNCPLKRRRDNARKPRRTQKMQTMEASPEPEDGESESEDEPEVEVEDDDEVMEVEEEETTEEAEAEAAQHQGPSQSEVDIWAFAGWGSVQFGGDETGSSSEEDDNSDSMDEDSDS